jgi:cytochrome c
MDEGYEPRSLLIDTSGRRGIPPSPRPVGQTLSLQARLMRVSPPLMIAGLLAALPMPALAQQAGNADLGKRVFQRCAACHANAPGAAPRFGPNLHGVLGRKVASVPGYSYSAALKTQKFIWTEVQLDKWLKGPRKLVPGTAMSFSGVPDAAERKAVIAYLKAPTP